MGAAVRGALAIVAAIVVEVVTAGTGTFISSILFAYGLGQLSTALNGKPNTGGAPAPWQFMANGSTYPGTGIYGSTRVSGLVVFQQTSGSKNQYLWYVLAIAAHQLDSMTDVWFDNVNIPTANINGSTGAITSNKYAGFANIWKYTGTDGQVVDPNLTAVFPQWDSNHRGRGVAYIVIRLQQDSTTYPTGAPQNFFVTVQGRRLYDPRLDSTNGGSGSQRLTDATTWTFSSNPALAAADYITGGSNVYDVATPVNVRGMGESTSRIDWALVSNAANICDQTPSIPGSTTQTRYKLAGAISYGDTHATNLAKIVGAMAGQVVPRGGKYRIYAGAYDSPTITVTDSDLVGTGYELLAQGRANLYNAVSPIYVDPTRNYQQVPSAINTNSSYVTADGEKIPPKSVDLTMVDNEYRSQRIGALILAQSRNLISLTLHLGINGFKLSSWDTFNLTLIEPAWVAKVFRIIGWQFAPDTPGVDLTLLEESSTAYTDPLAASYAAPGSATGGANTSDAPNTPLSFTANPVADAIIFTWAQSSYFPPGATYKLFRYTSGTPFSSATQIWQGTSTSYTLPITDSTNPTLFYWVVASYAGANSDPIPGSSSGLPSKALSVTTGFRVTCASATCVTALASGATGSVTGAISGGTPAFTYAWTYQSGDTSITCTFPTAVGTTFGRSGMVNLTEYDAIWRLTVTDSTSATCHVDIGVTFVRDTSLGH
jgi:hypothetical protein